MAVSHFTDNKLAISRFKRKKIFIRSVLLIFVKNYSQRTALFDVPTILPLLVLGAVKRKPSSLFRSWGSAPSSNTETLSSEGSLSYSESWSALEIPDEDPSFLSSSCGTSMSQFTMNSTLETRFTDYFYQKITAHGDYQLNSWGIKPAIHGSRKYPLSPSFLCKLCCSHANK